ncbi:MAG: aminomethyltransferase family protein [Acidimicrobiia bacterium]
MILTTPFHSRLEPLNRTGLWSHWEGYLVAEKYQMAEKTEYFAIRNSAGVFDTSPLYKYRIWGRDAEQFLAGVLTRDPRPCPPGHAQYTIWCDDTGHVLEDGVVFRLSETEFMLTTARPNMGYLSDLAGRKAVTVEDVSTAFGALAVQGPRSRALVSTLFDGVGDLSYFDLMTAHLNGSEVIVSRTGFTGDLGFEIWVDAEAAGGLWDSLWERAAGWGVVPVGQVALLMARIEAGLLLIDVDFGSARLAWTENQRSTPYELGLGWMVNGLDRSFIGRRALRRHLGEETARWAFRGLIVDPHQWAQRHDRAGLVPPKDHLPHHGDLMIYDDEGKRAGWASSFMYSPMLQRHIALARVRPSLAGSGSQVRLEVTIDHDYDTVPALVAPLPLYDPARRTSRGTDQ